jgi:hypothetical protein
MGNPNDAAAAAKTDLEQNATARLAPFLENLQVPDIEVDKNRLRELFIQLWEYENGETLPPEDQHLTAIALFIYTAHNILSDYNIRLDRARNHIIDALRAAMAPDEEKRVAEERASGNPFKAFVETYPARVDEVYTWKNFLLEHKTSDETQWKYKMKKCWFAEFFIRFGRTDYIETACQFDRIPSEFRKDYADLKLENLFAKLGKLCQFTYKPAPKDS